MCGDLLLKFLKLYQKFRVLTERLRSIIDACKKHVKEDVEPEFKDMLKTLESSFDKFTNK